MRALPAMLLVHVAWAGSSERAMRAVKVDAPPALDGRLEDETWKRCVFSAGFTQREPHEGAPATFATEVCVAYDRRHLYVGVRMLDPEPTAIRKGLGRRDAPPESDQIMVMVDSYHDHRTAYAFWVNPSGTLADGTFASDNELDGSWDGVWDAVTAIDERGWSAEFRIPMATLRFDARPDLVFGIQLRRWISRLGEADVWAPTPRASNAQVSLFGHLTDLGHASPGLGLQFTPYGLVRSTVSRRADGTLPDDKAQPEIGADLKVPLSGTLTLDLTGNPDFGQVEVDPAVVNLTAFETFFPEKRPFFLEGSEIFQTPIRVLHTRRIGAAPPEPALADGEEVEELDPVSPVHGGAKITGRQGRSAVGALVAWVGESEALVREQTGSRSLRRASPQTVFSAARFRHAVQGNSTVGGVVTGVSREGETDAWAGGPDVDWKLGNLELISQAVASNRGDETGYAAAGIADYTGRVWGWIVRVDALSPEANLDDAGFVQRDGEVTSFALGRWRQAVPLGPFRETWVRAFTSNGADYDGFTIDRNIGAGIDETFTNRMTVFLQGDYSFSTRDNFETRGGIPYQRPASWGMQGNFATESGRDLVLSLGGSFRNEDGSPSVGPNLRLSVKLRNRIFLTPAIGYSRTRDRPRWVETITQTDGSEAFVFGDLDYDQAEASLRATVGITRDLSFQMFGQYLHARGRHDRFRSLTAPDTLESIAFSGDPDFQTTSLLVNALLRWEYLPMSAAYLVWTHRSATEGAVTSFEPLSAVGDLGNVRPDDVIVAKVSYLWQL